MQSNQFYSEKFSETFTKIYQQADVKKIEREIYSQLTKLFAAAWKYVVKRIIVEIELKGVSMTALLEKMHTYENG